MHTAWPPQGETNRWPRRRSRQEGACWKRGRQRVRPLPACVVASVAHLLEQVADDCLEALHDHRVGRLLAASCDGGW
jgi:hypothetical protein